MKTVDNENLKKNIIDNIDKNKEKYIKISHEIHERPEVGNEEFFACDILTEVLREEGFEIEKNIASHETAFIARKKSIKHSGSVIGYLAEYDALPNLGHACGHNIIGTASVASAIGLSKVIDDIGGEVVVLGTPAEEGCKNGSAKASFVKHNLLDDIDVCMMIHPSNENCVTQETLAVDPLDFEFIGRAAHAAACPENGINALDGVIQLFNGISALRQQLTSDVRIHGVITHGGDAPNIIPEYAKARFYIRAATRERCNEVTKKVKNVAKGAALSTGSEVNIIAFQNGVDDFKINTVFDEIFADCIKELGININTKEGKGIGSTDAGNISKVVPTIHPYIKIGSSDLKAHTPEFCIASKSKEGDEALIVGSKALALTGLALIVDEEKIKKIKTNFSCT